MTVHSLQRLEFLTVAIPPLLAEIGEPEFSAKPAAGKWSKKEIIGHLIDSAANNHQRFIRGQFEDDPVISYDQNEWNKSNHYQQIDGKQIIAFWTIYNKQLIEIIKHIPEENLNRTVRIGSKSFTLIYLINDYVEHLEYHLKQMVSYGS